MLLQSLDHHWKEHLSTLDALRQVIHLRAYAQKTPINEYKQEAFALFERMLVSIRENVTQTLATNMFYQPPPQFQQMPDLSNLDLSQLQGLDLQALQNLQNLPGLQGLPDFITNHIDPFTGDDDTADVDAGTGNILSRLPPLQIEQPAMPRDVNVAELPQVSRNAPCPCGSGLKYKHCHGQLA